MKNKVYTGLICALLTQGALAESVRWSEAPKSQEISALAEKNAPLAATSRKAMSFSEPLEADRELRFDNSGHTESSKHFYLDTTAGQLSKGLDLPLTDGQAVIRISPLLRGEHPNIARDSVELQQRGQRVSVGTFVNQEELDKVGMKMHESTFAMQVNTGIGALKLKVNGLKGDAPYVVSVQEKFSDYVLDLSTTERVVASGGELRVDAALLAQGEPRPVNLAGYVTAPGGEKVAELKFAANADGRYTGRAQVGQGRSLANGIWTVYVVGTAEVDGVKVTRDNSNSFAVAVPTAQFNGQLTLLDNSVSLGIDVAQAGRYSVRGVLTGLDSEGVRRPLAHLSSADWLEVGSAGISVPLDGLQIAESGLQPPYQIKGLHLLNLTLLAPVQQLQEGLLISEAPAIAKTP